MDYCLTDDPTITLITQPFKHAFHGKICVTAQNSAMSKSPAFSFMDNFSAKSCSLRIGMDSKHFGDLGLDLWSRTVCSGTLWSFTINNLKEFFLVKYALDRIIFKMHTAPEAGLLYVPGEVCFLNMVLDFGACNLYIFQDY